MTFTIDNDNNITAHATPEEAAATTATPFDTFSSRQDLADLIATWPAERLVAIWNALPGVAPVKRFKTSNVAATRIWARIQGLGETAEPKPEPQPAAKPKAGKKATGRAQAAKGAPATGKSGRKASAPKSATKGKKAAKVPESDGPREGSKMAQVIAMLQRKGGASITEIMTAMGWQRHTVRGFMAGAMKKGGFTVESFRPEGGERSYRLPK